MKRKYQSWVTTEGEVVKENWKMGCTFSLFSDVETRHAVVFFIIFFHTKLKYVFLFSVQNGVSYVYVF